jgi:hypothetical protein
MIAWRDRFSSSWTTQGSTWQLRQRWHPPARAGSDFAEKNLISCMTFCAVVPYHRSTKAAFSACFAGFPQFNKELDAEKKERKTS